MHFKKDIDLLDEETLSDDELVEKIKIRKCG